MNKYTLILASSAMPLALAVAAAPAQAAVHVLTFDGFACTNVDGGLTNQNCTANGQFLGADYGSTTGLAVSYDASENTGSITSLRYTTDRFYLGTSGKAYAPAPGPAGELSKIFFTPAAGYEVSFMSFEWDKLTATTSADFIFKVLDSVGTELYSGGIGASHTVNTAFYAGPLTFLFGNGGRGAAAVENVTVNVRLAAVVGPAVPEPASWAMMIAGFGLVGSTMRNVRRRAWGATA